MDAYDENELVCRICRCEAEAGSPLKKPCKCTGSVGLVHDGCVKAWLSQSGRETCELCRYRYVWLPVFPPGSPSVLPTGEIAAAAVGYIVRNAPLAVHYAIAVFTWGILLPWIAAYTYRAAVHFQSFSVSGLMSFRLSQARYIFQDWVSGVLVLGFLIFSGALNTSIADFLRNEANRISADVAKRARTRRMVITSVERMLPRPPAPGGLSYIVQRLSQILGSRALHSSRSVARVRATPAPVAGGEAARDAEAVRLARAIRQHRRQRAHAAGPANGPLQVAAPPLVQARPHGPAPDGLKETLTSWLGGWWLLTNGVPRALSTYAFAVPVIDAVVGWPGCLNVIHYVCVDESSNVTNVGQHAPLASCSQVAHVSGPDVYMPKLLVVGMSLAVLLACIPLLITMASTRNLGQIPHLEHLAADERGAFLASVAAIRWRKYRSKAHRVFIVSAVLVYLFGSMLGRLMLSTEVGYAAAMHLEPALPLYAGLASSTSYKAWYALEESTPESPLILQWSASLPQWEGGGRGAVSPQPIRMLSVGFVEFSTLGRRAQGRRAKAQSEEALYAVDSITGVRNSSSWEVYTPRWEWVFGRHVSRRMTLGERIEAVATAASAAHANGSQPWPSGPPMPDGARHLDLGLPSAGTLRAQMGEGIAAYTAYGILVVYAVLTVMLWVIPKPERSLEEWKNRLRQRHLDETSMQALEFGIRELEFDLPFAANLPPALQLPPPHAPVLADEPTRVAHEGVPPPTLMPIPRAHGEEGDGGAEAGWEPVAVRTANNGPAAVDNAALGAGPGMNAAPAGRGHVDFSRVGHLLGLEEEEEVDGVVVAAQERPVVADGAPQGAGALGVVPPEQEQGGRRRRRRRRGLAAARAAVVGPVLQDEEDELFWLDAGPDAMDLNPMGELPRAGVIGGVQVGGVQVANDGGGLQEEDGLGLAHILALPPLRLTDLFLHFCMAVLLTIGCMGLSITVPILSARSGLVIARTHRWFALIWDPQVFMWSSTPSPADWPLQASDILMLVNGYLCILSSAWMVDLADRAVKFVFRKYIAFRRLVVWAWTGLSPASKDVAVRRAYLVASTRLTKVEKAWLPKPLVTAIYTAAPLTTVRGWIDEHTIGRQIIVGTRLLTFLFMRLVLLPVLTGVFCTWCVSPLAGAWDEEGLAWSVHHPLSFLMTAWLYGAMFLTVATTALLQLREGLRYELLAQWTVPLDPHTSMFRRYSDRTGCFHIRSFLYTLCLMGAMAVLFLRLPANLLSTPGSAPGGGGVVSESAAPTLSVPAATALASLVRAVWTGRYSRGSIMVTGAVCAPMPTAQHNASPAGEGRPVDGVPSWYPLRPTCPNGYVLGLVAHVTVHTVEGEGVTLGAVLGGDDNDEPPFTDGGELYHALSYRPALDMDGGMPGGNRSSHGSGGREGEDEEGVKGTSNPLRFFGTLFSRSSPLMRGARAAADAFTDMFTMPIRMVLEPLVDVGGGRVERGAGRGGLVLPDGSTPVLRPAHGTVQLDSLLVYEGSAEYDVLAPFVWSALESRAGTLWALAGVGEGGGGMDIVAGESKGLGQDPWFVQARGEGWHNRSEDSTAGEGGVEGGVEGGDVEKESNGEEEEEGEQDDEVPPPTPPPVLRPDPNPCDAAHLNAQLAAIPTGMPYSWYRVQCTPSKDGEGGGVILPTWQPSITPAGLPNHPSPDSPSARYRLLWRVMPVLRFTSLSDGVLGAGKGEGYMQTLRLRSTGATYLVTPRSHPPPSPPPPLYYPLYVPAWREAEVGLHSAGVPSPNAPSWTRVMSARDREEVLDEYTTWWVPRGKGEGQERYGYEGEGPAVPSGFPLAQEREGEGGAHGTGNVSASTNGTLAATDDVGEGSDAGTVGSPSPSPSPSLVHTGQVLQSGSYTGMRVCARLNISLEEWLSTTPAKERYTDGHAVGGEDVGGEANASEETSEKGKRAGQGRARGRGAGRRFRSIQMEGAGPGASLLDCGATPAPAETFAAVLPPPGSLLLARIRAPPLHSYTPGVRPVRAGAPPIPRPGEMPRDPLPTGAARAHLAWAWPEGWARDWTATGDFVWDMWHTVYVTIVVVGGWMAAAVREGGTPTAVPESFIHPALTIIEEWARNAREWVVAALAGVVWAGHAYLRVSAYAVRAAGLATGLGPLRVHHSFSPLQVPLDAFIAHAALLLCLEVGKAFAWMAQTAWLSSLARALGVAPSVLPPREVLRVHAYATPRHASLWVPPSGGQGPPPPPPRLPPLSPPCAQVSVTRYRHVDSTPGVGKFRPRADTWYQPVLEGSGGPDGDWHRPCGGEGDEMMSGLQLEDEGGWIRGCPPQVHRVDPSAAGALYRVGGGGRRRGAGRVRRHAAGGGEQQGRAPPPAQEWEPLPLVDAPQAVPPPPHPHLDDAPSLAIALDIAACVGWSDSALVMHVERMREGVRGEPRVQLERLRAALHEAVGRAAVEASTRVEEEEEGEGEEGEGEGAGEQGDAPGAGASDRAVFRHLWASSSPSNPVSYTHALESLLSREAVRSPWRYANADEQARAEDEAILRFRLALLGDGADGDTCLSPSSPARTRGRVRDFARGMLLDLMLGGAASPSGLPEISAYVWPHDSTGWVVPYCVQVRGEEGEAEARIPHGISQWQTEVYTREVRAHSYMVHASVHVSGLDILRTLGLAPSPEALLAGSLASDGRLRDRAVPPSPPPPQGLPRVRVGPHAVSTALQSFLLCEPGLTHATPEVLRQLRVYAAEAGHDMDAWAAGRLYTGVGEARGRAAGLMRRNCVPAGLEGGGAEPTSPSAHTAPPHASIDGDGEVHLERPEGPPRRMPPSHASRLPYQHREQVLPIFVFSPAASSLAVERDTGVGVGWQPHVPGLDGLDPPSCAVCGGSADELGAYRHLSRVEGEGGGWACPACAMEGKVQPPTRSRDKAGQSRARVLLTPHTPAPDHAPATPPPTTAPSLLSGVWRVLQPVCGRVDALTLTFIRVPAFWLASTLAVWLLILSALHASLYLGRLMQAALALPPSWSNDVHALCAGLYLVFLALDAGLILYYAVLNSGAGLARRVAVACAATAMTVEERWAAQGPGREGAVWAVPHNVPTPVAGQHLTVLDIVLGNTGTGWGVRLRSALQSAALTWVLLPMWRRAATVALDVGSIYLPPSSLHMRRVRAALLLFMSLVLCAPALVGVLWACIVDPIGAAALPLRLLHWVAPRSLARVLPPSSLLYHLAAVSTPLPPAWAWLTPFLGPEAAAHSPVGSFTSMWAVGAVLLLGCMELAYAGGGGGGNRVWVDLLEWRCMSLQVHRLWTAQVRPGMRALAAIVLAAWAMAALIGLIPALGWYHMSVAPAPQVAAEFASACTFTARLLIVAVLGGRAVWIAATDFRTSASGRAFSRSLARSLEALRVQRYATGSELQDNPGTARVRGQAATQSR